MGLLTVEFESRDSFQESLANLIGYGRRVSTRHRSFTWTSLPRNTCGVFERLRLTQPRGLRKRFKVSVFELHRSRLMVEIILPRHEVSNQDQLVSALSMFMLVSIRRGRALPVQIVMIMIMGVLKTTTHS